VAALRSPTPARRLAAWLYTGPLGHLWSTGAEVVVLWSKWAALRVRERVVGAREKRQ
jgi:hypothetical protein